MQGAPCLQGQSPSRRGEGGERWLGKKDTGYLYKAFMVARCWGCDRVPSTCQHREQDAGDHKGPPRHSSPPSPLRMLMSFVLG
jgi:hypothetical protein